MGPQFTRSLVEILSSTLQRLEESADLRQDDPAVIELKRHILRTIAELEVAKAAHSGEHQQPIPVSVAITSVTTTSPSASEPVTAEPAVSAHEAVVEPVAAAPEVKEPAAATADPMMANDDNHTMKS
jgi:hypothetical protein